MSKQTTVAAHRLTCCYGRMMVFPQVNDQLPEAFSLLGYAFYLQPLIMPIIREMPEGRSGRQALTAAVHSSLLGRSRRYEAMWLQLQTAHDGTVQLGHFGLWSVPPRRRCAVLCHHCPM